MNKTLKFGKALLFVCMCIALIVTSVLQTNASENNDLNSHQKVVMAAKELGIKTGSDLAQNSFPHNEFGNFFQNVDKNKVGFSSDIIIVLENNESIISQTDLENYVNNPERTSAIGILFQTIDGLMQIVAVWDDNHGTPDVIEDLFNLSSSSGNSSRLLKSIEYGYIGDPDGDCTNVYVCFNHDDGGNTGFHNYASYIGKWDHVNTAHSFSRGAILVTNTGQNISIDSYTNAKFIPSASFEAVSIQ